MICRRNRQLHTETFLGCWHWKAFVSKFADRFFTISIFYEAISKCNYLYHAVKWGIFQYNLHICDIATTAYCFRSGKTEESRRALRKLRGKSYKVNWARHHIKFFLSKDLINSTKVPLLLPAITFKPA